jgi:ABC-type polysaccharide/polyol phosphate transport system ATPase subunit
VSGNANVLGGTSAPAIDARGVQKSFWIPHERQTTFKERALHPWRWLRAESRRLDALRGVSFDVGTGEFFGVIGRNGSGKSTLLKLLASIYRLDSGTIRVAGRLAPFIELGVGFNPELNAKDNVVLNGVMMGLSRREALSRFDRVIEYAELWEYTDLKLKNYSFGMQVRLAFSMMLEVDADVLLVDEVLAVGDLAFQEKCIASLRDMKSRGVTVVLVTHEMEAVESHCDRAMLLEDGDVDLIGEPMAVAERFIETVLPTTHDRAADGRDGAGVSAAWLADSTGRATQSIHSGEAVSFCATIRGDGDQTRPRLLLELLKHPEGVTLAEFRVAGEEAIPPLSAGRQATVRVEIEAGALQPGEYRLRYELSSEAGDRVMDRSAEPLRLRVIGEDRGRGVIEIPYRVAVDPQVKVRR